MHTIEAEIEVEVPGSQGQDYCYPKLEIVYTYIPGAREVRYGPGAGPAESAEVEVIDVNVLEDGGLEVDAKTLMKWADEWIHDKGYYDACENAAYDK